MLGLFAGSGASGDLRLPRSEAARSWGSPWHAHLVALQPVLEHESLMPRGSPLGRQLEVRELLAEAVHILHQLNGLPHNLDIAEVETSSGQEESIGNEVVFHSAASCEATGWTSACGGRTGGRQPVGIASGERDQGRKGG